MKIKHSIKIQLTYLHLNIRFLSKGYHPFKNNVNITIFIEVCTMKYFSLTHFIPVLHFTLKPFI